MSVTAPFAVVFNVLIVSKGNLNILVLFSGFCNLPLCLVTILAVETSELPTALVSVSEVLD